MRSGVVPPVLLLLSLHLQPLPAWSLSLHIASSVSSVPMGFSLPVNWTLVAAPGFNFSSSRVFPFVDGLQWGAEAFPLVWNTQTNVLSGSYNLPLPNPSAKSSVVFAILPPPTTATVGTPLPSTAVVSNPLAVTVISRTITPRHPAGRDPRIGLEWEPWFTPLNFDWQGGVDVAEAIPVIGRYDSFNRDAIRQHALWFMDAGVDYLMVDWTNNLWGKTSWDQRDPNVQQLCNATTLAMQVYRQMRDEEALPTPSFVLLLGFDNGPTTTLQAITEEMDWAVENYLANPQIGTEMFVEYLGKPLVVVFDGTGADHSSFSHPNFTVRWMASQLQSSNFQNEGYWSWMDGVLQPLITNYQGAPEAVTVTDAYFAGEGWLASSARGKQGGSTLVWEVASVVARVASGQSPAAESNLAHLIVNQWNEYAGQGNGAGYGPNHNIYVDCYSAELTNDMEPTSLQACGYKRPGVACGGYGFRQLNLLRAMGDWVKDPAALAGSTFLFVTSPAVGTTANASLSVSWSAITFTAAAPFATQTSIPTEYLRFTVDGALVTPAFVGSATATLSLAPLDPNVPHFLEVSVSGGGFATAYPLSLLDVDAGVPLAQPTAPTSMIAINVPNLVGA